MTEASALVTDKYSELFDAFEFPSFRPPFEHRADIDADAGAIFLPVAPIQE